MIEHRIKSSLKPVRPLMTKGLNTLVKLSGRGKFKKSSIDLTSHKIKVKGLGKNFDSYKIVQISDIHLGQWMNAERLRGIVKLANDQKPDLILITGDFVSYLLNEITKDLQEILSGLKAKDGVYAILGNHEYWENTEEIIKAIEGAGIDILINEVVTIKKGKNMVWLAGLDDIIDGKPDLKKVEKKITNDSPAIMMCHEPDYALEVTKNKKFFLQLSGHSHGGQVLLPGLPVLKGRMFKHFHNGMYDVDGMTLYVNRGVGTHLFRVRINCKPEISTFILKAR